MTWRVLVTGSRHWTDRDAIRLTLITAARTAGALPQETVVVHGGARGADQLAAEVAAEFGCTVEVHPADWDAHGRAAGPRRNAEMVAAGADIVLAFPLGASRGTRHCVAEARRAGIPVVEYAAAAPNGVPN